MTDYDPKKWSANTTEEKPGRFRASVAHWGGEGWLRIWTHGDIVTSRTRARNVAVKKIHELEASGYQRPPIQNHAFVPIRSDMGNCNECTRPKADHQYQRQQ